MYTIPMDMDRHWLLTWVTYRTWLPGDERGFVSHVRTSSGRHVINNIPGTPRDANIPQLRRYVESQLKCDPIQLTLPRAESLLEQFHETVKYRNWYLWAVGIMANHLHVVVGVPGDPEPSKILGDLKSYGSRGWNQGWGKPKSNTWWADSGSKRKLPNDDAILCAIKYVVDQDYPLLIWTAPIPELDLSGGRLV